MSMNNYSLFLIRWNGSPCVYGCIVWNEAERACTSFLQQGAAQVSLERVVTFLSS